LFRWLTVASSRRRPTRRRPPASRLCVESLEDRCLLSFSPAVTYLTELNPRAVAVSDFNNDGRTDLAVANNTSSTVSILLGHGDGGFQASRASGTGTGPRSILAGDLN